MTFITASATNYQVVFTTGSGIGSTALKDDTKSSAFIQSGADLFGGIQPIFNTSNVYQASDYGLRFSSGSKAGSLSLFLFKEKMEIEKIDVTIHPYNTKETGTLTINGVKQTYNAGESTEATVLTYEYPDAKPVNLLEMEATSGKRVYVSEMVVYVNDGVKEPSYSSVSLNASETTLDIAETFKVTATVSPANLAESLIWSSDNEAVATVAADGTVTAVSAGNATITASVPDTEDYYGSSASLKVTVNASLDANAARVTFIQGSGATQIKTNTQIKTFVDQGADLFSNVSAAETAYYKDTYGIRLGTASNAGSLKLKFSEPQVIEKIIVTAKSYNAKEGSTLTINGVSQEVTPADPATNDAILTYVYTNPQPTDILTLANAAKNQRVYLVSMDIYFGEEPNLEVSDVTLNESEITLDQGATFKAEATVSPADLAESLIWSSDNEAVATVAADGTVTAVSAGTAIITATVPQTDTHFGSSATLNVTVNATLGANAARVTFFKGTNATQITTSTKITTFVDQGADLFSNVSAVEAAYYKDTYGIRLGTASKAGSLTLNFSEPQVIEKIIVTAKSYNATEGSSLTINDVSQEVTPANPATNDAILTYVYTNPQATDILTLANAAKNQRVYLVSMDIYFGSKPCAAPVVTPAESGSIPVGTEITVTPATEGSLVYGFLNDEKFEAETAYTYTVTEADVNKTLTLTTWAEKEGMSDSETVELTFTVVEQPDFENNLTATFNWADTSSLNTEQEFNFDNQTYNDITHPVTNSTISIELAKGDGATTPRFFKDKQLRLYNKNILTVKVNSAAGSLSKIEFAGTSNLSLAEGQPGSFVNNVWTAPVAAAEGPAAAPAAPVTEVSFINGSTQSNLTATTVTYKDVTSSIETIDSEEEAPAVYYTLQGFRVNNPTQGIYIRVAGSKVSKIIVR